MNAMLEARIVAARIHGAAEGAHGDVARRGANDAGVGGRCRKSGHRALGPGEGCAFILSPAHSRSPIALGADPSRGHRLQNQAARDRFDEGIGAADVDIACRVAPARQYLAQQRSVEAPVEVVRAVPRVRASSPR